MHVSGHIRPTPTRSPPYTSKNTLTMQKKQIKHPGKYTYLEFQDTFLITRQTQGEERSNRDDTRKKVDGELEVEIR